MAAERSVVSERAPAPVPPPARLLSRLDRNCPLVVVRAPHGFGKATLIARWLEAGERVGRIAVRVEAPSSPMDSDGYWQLVAARLAAAGVTWPEHTPGCGRAWAETVRHMLTAASVPIRLALERLDLIEDPDLEAEILALVTACHSVDVVVTMIGRPLFADPVLMDPTHDFLDGDSLTFTQQDIQELFHTSAVELSEEEAALVRHLTGGLPSLMPVALRVASDLPALPHRLELLDRYLTTATSNRIHATVLAAPQIAMHRRFLFTTSTAHLLSAEVAEFLGGGPNPIAQLTALESAGVLEHVATTRKGDIWRLAPAVRTALLQARRAAGSDPAAELSRLARFHLDRGDKTTALRCAAEALDWHLVSHLLTAHWYDLLGPDMTEVHHVVLTLPDSVTAAFPRLRERKELLSRLNGTATDAAHEQDRIAPADDTSTILSVSHRSMMLRLAGEYARAAEKARQIETVLDRVLAHQPDEQLTYVLGSIRLQRGLTFQLDGDLTESVREFVRAYRLGTAQGIDYIARNSAYNLALNWAFVGESQRARQWLTHGRITSATDTMTERLVEIGGHAARAHIALDVLDIDAARTAIGKLQCLPPVAELWPYVVHARCRLAVASSDPRAGLRALDEYAEQRSRARGDFVTSLVDAAEIELHLANGDAWRAVELANTVSRNTPWSTVAVARTLLVTGDHRAAIDACHRFSWLGGPYTRQHLEALTIEAAALYCIGDETAAARSWTRAGEITARTGIRCVLADLPRQLVAALHALADASDVVADFLATERAEHYPPAPSLPTLTDREREVLAGIAEELTSPQIAARLFVTTPTVKGHLKGLYRKLGVHTRREAVQAGIRLGIVPRRPEHTVR